MSHSRAVTLGSMRSSTCVHLSRSTTAWMTATHELMKADTDEPHEGPKCGSRSMVQLWQVHGENWLLDCMDTHRGGRLLVAGTRAEYGVWMRNKPGMRDTDRHIARLRHMMNGLQFAARYTQGVRRAYVGRAARAIRWKKLDQMTARQWGEQISATFAKRRTCGSIWLSELMCMSRSGRPRLLPLPSRGLFKGWRHIMDGECMLGSWGPGWLMGSLCSGGSSVRVSDGVR
mmetsp:Transcript_38562/g.97086  ORF Transcript_38562/g.97086 Transcript_38562/m.97086 type:complete len:230 (+) Transcript_38562:711-1400(+)